MAKAVLTTKIRPHYNDLPELMYHFPKTYLRAVSATVGDWIVYYEPRREDASPSGRAGRQCYFATARVSHIKEDPAIKDHFYAFVENYLEFRVGSHYFESGLRKADGSTSKGAFGRAVRLVPDEEYQAILTAGLVKAEEEFASNVVNEPDLVYEVNRPVIQQIVDRPFREAAFSKIVKDEYGSACAMTGIGIQDARGNPEVEAAHIKPVRLKGPDSVRNGIALCRTFHWMMDRGLVSVADSGDILFKDIVPVRILELLNKDGKVRPPASLFSAPHPEFLKFHREEIFR
jgi:putative restriction endonuclease